MGFAEHEPFCKICTRKQLDALETLRYSGVYIKKGKNYFYVNTTKLIEYNNEKLIVIFLLLLIVLTYIEEETTSNDTTTEAYETYLPTKMPQKSRNRGREKEKLKMEGKSHITSKCSNVVKYIFIYVSIFGYMNFFISFFQK